MEEIFHEKQEGSLCAQHCLNALLQAAYFTAVDLGTIAGQIDEEERSRMAEGGVHSEDYRKFLQQPSSNVDDSGYFSVQVIASALKVWGLELIPYNSQNPFARSAQQDPTQHTAYICNYRDHWLTIRKIGYQWFNLNSLLTGPELISNTYLSLFLAQLQQEGYSIFIVEGKLPECASDKILRLQPAVQVEKPRLISEIKNQQVLSSSQDDDEDKALTDTLKLTLEKSMQDEDQDLQAALCMSLTEFQTATSSRKPQITECLRKDNQHETQQPFQHHIQQPIQYSTQHPTQHPIQHPTQHSNQHVTQQSIENFIQQPMQHLIQQPIQHHTQPPIQLLTQQSLPSQQDMSEQEMLEAAIKMSMETS